MLYDLVLVNDLIPDHSSGGIHRVFFFFFVDNFKINSNESTMFFLNVLEESTIEREKEKNLFL